MTAFLRQTWGLFLMVALQILFWQWPQIDLWFTGIFYDPAGGGFPFADNFLVATSYEVFRDAHWYYLALIGWLLFASWWWGGRGEAPVRRKLIYLVVVWLLGPGLLINEVVKAESGRARPRDVVEFSGAKPFTPAFEPAENCRRNCSFVSSHAGMAFFLIALAWPLRQRGWLWAGLLLGALVGFGRILEGAHFLSDVVFSFWLVYWTSAGVAWLLLGDWRIVPRRAEAAGA